MERVRITHPRTAAARSLPSRPPAAEIDEQTAMGELYVESLMRSQRRTAFSICGATVGMLVVLAVVLAEVDDLARITLLGIPLPWLVVAVAVYPVLVVIGLRAVRSAERDEREFIALMRHR